MLQLLAASLLFSALAADTAADPSTAPAPAAVAAQEPPASADAPAPAAAEKPKKICKKINGTGSRLDSGRLCKTAEEWKKFYAD